MAMTAEAATADTDLTLSPDDGDATGTTTGTTTGTFSVAVCEQLHNEVQVYPSASAWTDATCSWRFSPGTANGWDLLSDVKFRATTAFGTVALVTTSGGRAGIVQVSTKNVLWSATPGNNPHSVERIPNLGAIVVASSGGFLTVYAPTNSDVPSTLAQVQQLPYTDAHGVWWDDTANLLWAVGGTRITGFTVTGTDRAIRIAPSVIRDLGPAQGAGLHSLDASYSDSGALLISDGSQVFTFQKSTLNMTAMPVPTGLGSTVGIKSYGRDASGQSFWVKTTNTDSNGDGRNWYSPSVQFFDASGNPTVTRTPAYASGTPEIYRARLVNTGFH